MPKKKRREKHPSGKDTKTGLPMPDFLPKPEELAGLEKKVKITITLNHSSVKFFKKQAKKFDTPYQAMIRNLLQQYAQRAAE